MWVRVYLGLFARNVSQIKNPTSTSTYHNIWYFVLTQLIAQCLEYEKKNNSVAVDATYIIPTRNVRAPFLLVERKGV